MKLVTFETKSGDQHIGALLDGEDQVVDFTASATDPPLRNMLSSNVRASIILSL